MDEAEDAAQMRVLHIAILTDADRVSDSERVCRRRINYPAESHSFRDSSGPSTCLAVIAS